MFTKRFFLIFIFIILPSELFSQNLINEFIKEKEVISFCGNEIKLEKLNLKERLEKEFLLYAFDKPQVLLWLKRTPRYFNHIEKVLKENNLPQDLKYVAVVESALRTDIRSSRNAVGIWQFIRPTAVLYGLEVNKSYDERRDSLKATKAASEYLKDLYERFENWELALAAYNIGEMRIERELESQKTDNFYELILPEETMRYVFKIIAAKLIYENHNLLGFYLDKDDYYKSYNTKEVKVILDNTVPVNLASEVLDISFYQFRLLNPAVTGNYFKTGNNTFKIPENTDKKEFLINFKKLRKKWYKEHNIFYYTVEPGDSLIKISEQFKVMVKDVLEWNKMDYSDYIYPGQKLIIKSRKK
ncbi:MAG: transglycosylase SLT domain-containing protein [Candidatus Muiribacteriota bacterium]